MSKCKNCKVEILDHTETCPLCQSVLEQTEEMENMYPDAGHKTQKLLLFSRLYLFCALVIECILYVIDYQRGSEISWSILAGLGFLYIYIILRYAIIGKSGYKIKTIVLAIITVLLAIAYDFATGYRGWAVDYIISICILAVDIAIIVLMIYNRRNWQSYMMWQIFMVICSLIPMHLYFLGYERNSMMALLPFGVSGFLFLGTWIIGGRRAWLELKRRFHI